MLNWTIVPVLGPSDIRKICPSFISTTVLQNQSPETSELDKSYWPLLSSSLLIASNLSLLMPLPWSITWTWSCLEV